MEKSVWAVEFLSNLQSLGRGVVTIDGESITGGDGIYYYIGSCSISDQNVSAMMKVEQHGPGQSIFGPINAFTVKLTGTIDQNSMQLTGAMIENPQLTVQVKLKKLLDI